MFADDRNLSYSHKNITTLFQIVNSELKLVNEWFLANKLSLNAKKNQNVLFHKVSICDSLPLHLPTMTLLDFKNLLKIYFSFIHIYINHANIAWASTFKTNLQGILKKQKHAARITFHANRLDRARPLLKEMKALNVYQINLIQTLKFMHKTKYGKNPRIFLPKFREVDHQYPTRFSQNSFCHKRSACKTTSFTITLRGPTIWNRS